MRKRCRCGYWNEITREMLAGQDLSAIRQIASGDGLATPGQQHRQQPTVNGGSHMEHAQPMTHSVNAPESSQSVANQGLATLQPGAQSGKGSTTGTSCTREAATFRGTKTSFDDLWLKRPITYILKKSNEKFGYGLKVCELDLISYLTNVNDPLNKKSGKLPSQRDVSRDLLYGGKGDGFLVDHTYLSRLVKKWTEEGYVFKEGTTIVANREYFDWGRYPPKELALLQPVQGYEHHYEFWLVPDDGYAPTYWQYYGMCGSLTSGARNAGQKRVVIDKLKLYGVTYSG